MADEEPEQNEGRLFTLTEAERTRREIEPTLIEAMGGRRKLAEAEMSLAKLATKIMMSGGLMVNYERAARMRTERERWAVSVKQAIENIEATGCVVKDLDTGLLDFPSRIDGEDVYLCWKLGEDRIRFWHRQDEGFAGRKPIDPRDPNGIDTAIN